MTAPPPLLPFISCLRSFFVCVVLVFSAIFVVCLRGVALCVLLVAMLSLFFCCRCLHVLFFSERLVFLFLSFYFFHNVMYVAAGVEIYVLPIFLFSDSNKELCHNVWSVLFVCD